VRLHAADLGRIAHGLTAYQDATAEREVAAHARSARVLILDDLGKERLTPAVVEFLQGLLDARYVARRCTLITANMDCDTFEARYDFGTTAEALRSTREAKLARGEKPQRGTIWRRIREVGALHPDGGRPRMWFGGTEVEL
jgi:hypothetical protein